MTAVSGTVVFEADGEPAAGADVLLIDRDDERLEAVLTTGSDGAFSTTASAGSLHVKVEHEEDGQHYQARSTYAREEAGEDYEGLTFELEPYDVPAIDDWTLTLEPPIEPIGHQFWRRGDGTVDTYPLFAEEDVEGEGPLAWEIQASNGETGYLMPLEEAQADQYLGFTDGDGEFWPVAMSEDDI